MVLEIGIEAYQSFNAPKGGNAVLTDLKETGDDYVFLNVSMPRRAVMLF